MQLLVLCVFPVMHQRTDRHTHGHTDQCKKSTATERCISRWRCIEDHAYGVCRFACDIGVVRLLRHRGLGNSVTQLHKQLCEQHSEDWLTRTVQYFTACRPFSASSLVAPHAVARPPARPPLPKPQWLLSVYVRDVLNRVDDVKAKLTSVFGTVLKMDSTKKVLLLTLLNYTCASISLYIL